MTEPYLRPGNILQSFTRFYPDAWKQVDEFRASRKELGGWADWCFLPLAATHAIVSKGKAIQSSTQARNTTKKRMRIFAPDQPSRWDVGYRLGAALRQALSEHEHSEPTGTHASPRPHIRRAHWHSFWVGKKDQPDARSVTLKWLPPIPVNVTGIEDLTTTVRDVGN